MKTVQNYDVLTRFSKNTPFTTHDAYEYYNSLQPGVRKNTVNWRLYHLVQQSVLQRIGRGIYVIDKKPHFIYAPGKEERACANKIKQKFPFVSYCVWHTSLLQEFYHHAALFNCMIVEVEREAVEAVFHFLNETHKNTFREPGKELVEDFIFSSNKPVIVKPLISEAPVQKNDGVYVPALEKILVDVYVDDEVFAYVQGNEFLSVMNSALDRYAINYDKLLRYAARRGKRNVFTRIIQQINDKT
jgi:hypothetical protein